MKSTRVRFSLFRGPVAGRYIVALLLCGALLAAGCSSSGDDAESEAAESTSESSGSDSVSESEPESDDGSDSTEAEDRAGDAPELSGSFCDRANEFNENTFANEFNPAQPEFYETNADALTQVLAEAPGEIRGDITLMRDAFLDMAETVRPFGGNMADPGLAAAFEDFETDELDAAGDRIEAFLAEECGIDIGADEAEPPPLSIPADASADDAAALFFQQQFGVDADTAACLAEEVGDLSGGAGLDPSLLTQEICGVSLLEVMQG